MMLAEGVEKIFHYWEPWPDGLNASRPDRFTWFEYDGSLKPYAAVYAVGAYFLDDARPVKAPALAEGVFVRAFQRSAESVLVLWTDNAKPVRVDVAAILGFEAAFDMFGAPAPIADHVLEVGQCALYVTCRSPK